LSPAAPTTRAAFAQSRQKRHFGTGTLLAQALFLVNIRFTSTLTPEDENTLAPALLRALASILDLIPIAYVIRIDTSDSQVYQHSRPTECGAAVDEQFRSKPAVAAPYDS
jgi:hypothetical protein